MSRSHTHAGKGGNRDVLCGSRQARRITQPGELVQCRACLSILKHLQEVYPERFGYRDTRLTKDQHRDAVATIVADMRGGADD